MRFSVYIAFCVLLGLVSCIDPYHPEVKGDKEGKFVIEGMITDQPGQQRVYVSKTRSFNDPNRSIPERVSGAEVQISDDERNMFLLTELTAGVYASGPEVRGVIGRSYQLKVSYQGKEYISEPELLTPSSEPVSIGARFAHQFVEEGSNEAFINRVLFYLDLDNTTGGTSDFYKYSVDFTYEIKTPHWETPYICGDTSAVEKTPEVCYVREEPAVFLNILSLKGFTGSKYQEHFLTDVGANRRFMSKFSILIKQYSMTERAFNYWEDIQEQNLRTGSLFDPPPSRILGNIRSVTDPYEPVFGYFMASSEKQIRGFVTPTVLEATFENFDGCDCFPEKTVKCLGAIPPSEPFDMPFPSHYCCDCRTYPNATAEKPSFWTD